LTAAYHETRRQLRLIVDAANRLFQYAREFPDVAAKGCYRVDIHEGTGLTFWYLDGSEAIQKYDLVTKKTRWFSGRWRPETPTNPTYYSIPYRLIVPEGAEYVLTAGRMLDCPRKAFGALRVLVNCNQLGEVAGRSAVKAIDEGLSVDKAYPGAQQI